MRNDKCIIKVDQMLETEILREEHRLPGAPVN